MIPHSLAVAGIGRASAGRGGLGTLVDETGGQFFESEIREALARVGGVREDTCQFPMHTRPQETMLSTNRNSKREDAGPGTR